MCKWKCGCIVICHPKRELGATGDDDLSEVKHNVEMRAGQS